MAIRNDFAPGEVLAAADLNDTFGSKLDYPAGGSDGDLLAKDGTDAEWIAVPEAGLTLITSESFSAVSSVNINGCFSATYERYLLQFRGLGSEGLAIFWRMRSSGTSDSGNNYNVQTLIARDTSAFADRALSTSQGRFADVDVNAGIFVSQFFNPFLATRTTVVTQFTRSGATLFDVGINASEHTLANSYDGIELRSTVGNFSGTLRIYGYRN
jgi:hypothetical protein